MCYRWLHNLSLFHHSAPRHHCTANAGSTMNFIWIQDYLINESSLPVRHTIDLLSCWQGDCSKTQVDICIPLRAARKRCPGRIYNMLKDPGS